MCLGISQDAPISPSLHTFLDMCYNTINKKFKNFSYMNHIHWRNRTDKVNASFKQDLLC